MVTTFILDIETRPDPAMDTADYWAWRERKMEPPGNIKDPLKIAAAMQEKVATARAKMALNPSTGLVPVIGILSWEESHSPNLLVASEATRSGEEQLLRSLLGMLGGVSGEPALLLGWNLRRFDIPFLTFRFAVHNIELPRWWPHPRDWNRIFDLYSDLGLDMPMSELQYCWGGGFKEVDGADLLKLSLDELAEHCRQDMQWTATIAERFAPIWRRIAARN